MKFLRDIAVNVGASGFGIALALGTTPLMTRLFSPEAYGQNGLLVSLMTVFSALGLLGLPIALAREHEAAPRALLIGASMVVAAFAVLAAAVLAVVWAVFFERFDFPNEALVLVPLMALVYSLHAIGTATATATGAFPALARGRIADAFGARFGTLALGWIIAPKLLMLIIGDLAGKLAKLAILCKSAPVRASLSSGIKKDVLLGWRGALSAYREFVLFANVAQALPVAVAVLLNWYVAVRLDIAATGQFVLVNSVLSMVVSTIALAAAPVVFHRFAHTADHKPSALPKLTLRVGLAFSLVGLFCMAPVIAFGPELFGFAFGDAWRPAGELGRWLSIAFVPAFSLTVLLPMFRVMRQIRAWFWTQLVAFSFFAAALLLFARSEDLAQLGKEIASIRLAYNLALHFPLWWILQAKPKPIVVVDS